MTKNTIIQFVASETNITVQEITGTNRFREVADARKLCMILIKETCEDETLHSIARPFKKSHCTVLHSVQRAYDLLKTDNAFKRKYEACKSSIALHLQSNQYLNIPQF